MLTPYRRLMDELDLITGPQCHASDGFLLKCLNVFGTVLIYVSYIIW